MRIYCDLDNVLVHPVLGGPLKDQVIRIVPRPNADWFLRKLAGQGDVWLLTASCCGHPGRALRVLGPSTNVLSGVISREHLAPVEEQIRVVQEAGVGEQERRELWSLIRPIAPPGVVFDDFPVGSDMFLLKATAVGIGPEHWVQVEHFGEGRPDNGGLRRAYAEFRRRFGSRMGTRLRHGVLV